MLRLKLHSRWEAFTGHCQITYEAPRPNYAVYCLQEYEKGKVRLMRCSRDGEPSHQVHFHGSVEFERPPRDTRLGEVVNAYLDGLEVSRKSVPGDKLEALVNRTLENFQQGVELGLADKEDFYSFEVSEEVSAAMRKVRAALYAAAIKALEHEGVNVEFADKKGGPNGTD